MSSYSDRDDEEQDIEMQPSMTYEDVVDGQSPRVGADQDVEMLPTNDQAKKIYNEDNADRCKKCRAVKTP